MDQWIRIPNLGTNQQTSNNEIVLKIWIGHALTSILIPEKQKKTERTGQDTIELIISSLFWQGKDKLWKKV